MIPQSKGLIWNCSVACEPCAFHDLSSVDCPAGRLTSGAMWATSHQTPVGKLYTGFEVDSL